MHVFTLFFSQKRRISAIKSIRPLLPPPPNSFVLVDFREEVLEFWRTLRIADFESSSKIAALPVLNILRFMFLNRCDCHFTTTNEKWWTSTIFFFLFLIGFIGWMWWNMYKLAILGRKYWLITAGCRLVLGGAGYRLPKFIWVLALYEISWWGNGAWSTVLNVEPTTRTMQQFVFSVARLFMEQATTVNQSGAVDFTKETTGIIKEADSS